MNYSGFWRGYMRIRVNLDVRNLLKRWMRIKKNGGDWLWVMFKYERLPNFCFICGIIGHIEKLCECLIQANGLTLERAYGPDLRAMGWRLQYCPGDRWLRDTLPTADGDDQLRGQAIEGITDGFGQSLVTAMENVGGRELVGAHNGKLPICPRQPCNLCQDLRRDKVVLNAHQSDVLYEGIVSIDPKRRR